MSFRKAKRLAKQVPPVSLVSQNGPFNMALLSVKTGYMQTLRFQLFLKFAFFLSNFDFIF